MSEKLIEFHTMVAVWYRNLFYVNLAVKIISRVGGLDIFLKAYLPEHLYLTGIRSINLKGKF